MNKNIFELLETSYLSNNIGEVYNSLLLLQPNKLSIKELVSLVKFVEAKFRKSGFQYEHYNIIGTGGDTLKTINISSIAAIIASKYVNVVKIGARGVTSKFGSKDFNSFLLSKALNSQRQFYFFNDKSKFLSFNDLGLAYSEALVEARRKINKEGYLDIFKVVFPFANFTGCYGQVNGVSNKDYLSLFVELALKFNRHCILVYSNLGIDEIMPGENQYVTINNNQIKESKLMLPSSNIEFFIESENSEILIQKFKSIMTKDTSDEVLKTIFYNTAAIINLKEKQKSIQDIYETYFNNK
jgi:anthranilate phosphoribosyltransferase